MPYYPPEGAAGPKFSATNGGEVPASGGGTSNFLRADGAWAVPPGAGGGGGYAFVGNFRVATAGDNFIAVNLNSDNNQIYRVTVIWLPSADASLTFTISDDAGATWKTGASDYKSGTTGATANVTLTATCGTGRNCMVEFVLHGMNDASATAENGWMQVLGAHRSISAAGNPSNGQLNGSNNALGAGNWNAFRILASAGNLNAAHVIVDSMRIV